ncbi:MAG: UDP-N-acetylmuramate dehydrogenase [Ruminococcaceae bacterium]|nr:UDP-N-acetylmuramate dehydrogenase [Oscillospiraceae bacterium]
MYQTICDYARSLGCNAVENEPMKQHISFKVGGNAKAFIEPNSEENLLKILQKCKESAVHYAVIGNGSNLLVRDEGFEGVVIHLGSAFGKMELVGEDTIWCEAGAGLMKVCNFALANALTGLEFAYGIPGSAGGAAFMNAGAYGGEMKDVLYKCTHIDNALQSGALEGDALALSYRYSAYCDNGAIITGLYMKLKKGEKTAIKAKMEELYGRRKDKQPLEYPSAGSTFKRPEGYFAGKLIEDAGLKGARVGGAAVSEKHAGFVVNLGGATCSDILQLCDNIHQSVMERYGVSLEREVKILE